MAKPANTNNEAASKEAALRTWRRILKNDPAMARDAVQRAMGLLMSTKVFCSYELAQFRSQMMNGVACPGEFGISSEHGCAKRA